MSTPDNNNMSNGNNGLPTRPGNINGDSTGEETPRVVSPRVAKRRAEMAEEQAQQVQEEAATEETKKTGKLGRLKRKKKDVAEPAVENIDKTADDSDEDAEDTTEKKQKKSLKEMTFADLIPSRKSKAEPMLPIGNNILIDLMPQSHKELVEVRQAKRRWVSIFSTVVIACVIISSASFAYNLQTQSRVSSELSTQETLDLQIAEYSEVNTALQSQEQAETLLNGAAGSEIDWNRLITTIEESLPAGTSVGALSVTTGGTVEDEISSAITMDLTSDSTLGYSDSLDAMQNINGVEQVEIGGLAAASDGRYVYTMSFTYDTSILTKEFAFEQEGE